MQVRNQGAVFPERRVGMPERTAAVQSEKNSVLACQEIRRHSETVLAFGEDTPRRRFPMKDLAGAKPARCCQRIGWMASDKN